MAKTPFAFAPMGTPVGLLVTIWLSFVYGCLAFFRLIVELIRNGPKVYFTMQDRNGRNRPSEVLDRYGTHKFINLKNQGIKLHYVEAGSTDDQLMLFLHGFPECWFSWRHQIEAFKGGYRTVAVNMRGYGESDKPEGVDSYKFDLLVDDIIELIESLVTNRQPKCILVAHDWGGVIAWTVTQQRPDLIDRFIVLNAPHATSWMYRIATSWKQFFSSWYMFFFNCPYLPEISIRSNDFKIFDLLFGKYARSADETAVYKHYYGQPYGITGPLNYYRARLRGYSDLPAAKMIQSKTLVLWGRNDTALIGELAEDSAQLCVDATVEYFDNCSHWIMLERPDEVNQSMAKFLATR